MKLYCLLSATFLTSHSCISTFNYIIFLIFRYMQLIIFFSQFNSGLCFDFSFETGFHYIVPAGFKLDV